MMWYEGGRWRASRLFGDRAGEEREEESEGKEEGWMKEGADEEERVAYIWLNKTVHTYSYNDAIIRHKKADVIRQIFGHEPPIFIFFQLKTEVWQWGSTAHSSMHCSANACGRMPTRAHRATLPHFTISCHCFDFSAFFSRPTLTSTHTRTITVLLRIAGACKSYSIHLYYFRGNPSN